MNNIHSTNSESKMVSEKYKINPYKTSHNNEGIHLLKQFIHDIRNLHSFSREALIQINNLPYDDRLEILHTYNAMITYYSNIFDDNEVYDIVSNKK